MVPVRAVGVLAPSKLDRVEPSLFVRVPHAPSGVVCIEAFGVGIHVDSAGKGSLSVGELVACNGGWTGVGVEAGADREAHATPLFVFPLPRLLDIRVGTSAGYCFV